MPIGGSDNEDDDNDFTYLPYSGNNFSKHLKSLPLELGGGLPARLRPTGSSLVHDGRYVEIRVVGRDSLPMLVY